jgi:hypothetical protein
MWGLQGYGGFFAPTAGSYSFKVVADDANIRLGVDLLTGCGEVVRGAMLSEEVRYAYDVTLSAAVYTLNLSYRDCGAAVGVFQLLWKKPGDAEWSVLPFMCSSV